ncbi:unnamed protein product [Allacma fusca]|uniref:Uncharacterized protein n=1 Tax=Allacma fusca TaxID=39272 RepID=A0A8J2JE42_9HEXA|nr:unnamed protein product [Allacma fusca]
MKQVLRQLMGIHHASVLLLRTTGNYARPLVTCNAKIFESVRKFSSTQGDVKESDSTVVKKEEASEPQLDQIPGKLEPEIEARIEHFKQKRQQRKDLLSMDEEELAPYAIGMKQKSYLERVEGPYAKAGISRFLEQDRDEKYNMTDQIAFMQQDLDFRIPAIKRYFAKVNEEWEIKLQKYNAQRNAVLGDDLAAAHFIVFRKGRVKFVGQDNWVDKYRTDQEQEENELDLPDMQFDLCVLPTAYDPNYLVEAIDATNIPLRYEGLDNLGISMIDGKFMSV